MRKPTSRACTAYGLPGELPDYLNTYTRIAAAAGRRRRLRSAAAAAWRVCWRLAVVFALFVLVGLQSGQAAAAEPWSETDRALASVAVGYLEADRLQTLQIASDPRWVELNPLLGPHPSPDQVNLHFALATVGTLVLADQLTGRARQAFLLAVIVLQAAVVQHNATIGLRWEVARW